MYLPTFSDAKGWDFHQDIVESLHSYLKNIYARKPSENLRRQSKRFRRCSDHLRNSVPGYYLPSTTSSLSKIRESFVEDSSHYCFGYKYTLTYFIFFKQAFVRYGSNNSYFPVRREKLVCWHDWAWGQSFRLADIRLTPKAWEFAGLAHRLVNVIF